MRKYLFSLLMWCAGISLFAVPLSETKECTLSPGWDGVSNWTPMMGYGTVGANLSSAFFLAEGTFPGAGVGAIPDRGVSGCGEPAGAPLEVTFNVTGMSGDLLDLSVSIALSHTWMGDVRAELFAPDGTSHILFGRTGTTTATGCGDSSIFSGGTYNFTDSATGANWWAAAATAGFGAAMPAGDYRTTAIGPQTAANSSPVTSILTAFSGVANLNGTWTLRFWDYGGGDTGSVASANLSIETEETTPPPTGCLTAGWGAYPSAAVTPACRGDFSIIASDCYAGEFSRVNVVAGTEYTFKGSIATDLLTIANATGTTVYTSGFGEVTWTATANGVVRFYTHTNDSCGESTTYRTRAVKCGTPTTAPDPVADCFQGNEIFGLVNGYGVISSDVFRVADDFIVEPGVTFSLEEITLHMFAASTITNTTINIRQDNAGSPGAVLHTVTMAPTTSTQIGTPFTGLNAYKLVFDLATPFELTEGKYWVEPTTTADTYWEITTLGDTGSVLQLSNTSGTSWVADDSGFDYDAVFFVAGECITGPTGCLTATYGLFPEDTVSPFCVGVTTIATNTWAGEYTNVEVTAGSEYTFASSVSSDFITIGNTDGTAVIASGTGSLIWTADADQVVRFYIHADENCTNQMVSRTKTVACGEEIPVEEPDFACFQGDGLAGNGENGYGIVTTSVNRTADDFIVADGTTFTVEQITLSLMSHTDITSVNLNIYADNGGAIGAVEEAVSGIVPTSQEVVTLAFGYPVRQVVLDLPTPLVFEAGTYWLSPDAVNTGAAAVFWEVTSTGTLGAPVWRQTTTVPAWTVDATGMDAVFFISGTCDTVAEPEGCLNVNPDLSNGGQYPSATYTPECTGVVEAITTLAWTGEFSKVAVTAGTEYIFSTNTPTDFLTIGNSDGTVVLAAGVGSVTWTADADQEVRFYSHLSDECDWVASGLRSRTVQCGDILPPPANDDCEDAIALSCGDSETGSTTFATDSGGNDSNDVFYTFTGDGTEQLVTVSLCGSSYDTYLAVYTDCTLSTEVASNDDSCDLQSELSFVSDGTSTYVILVEGYSGLFGSESGNFTIAVSCGEVPPPPATCDDQFMVSNNLENGLFFGGDTNQSLAVDVIVGDEGFPVYGVDLNVFTNGNTDLDFSATFYTDSGGTDGVPDTVVETVNASVYSSDYVGNAFGFDVYNYVIAFDTPVNLDANTTYWMQIESDGLAWEATTAQPFLGSGLSFNNTNVGVWTNDPLTELVYELVCEDLKASDLNSFDFAYYPNPVKDVLNISSKKGVESVSAFNLAGQKVLSNAKVSNGQIDVNALTPGTYVFRVTLEGGQVETFKIIKK